VRRKPREGRLSFDEMARRYRDGETCEQIAATAGLRLGAVYRRLRSAGVKFRPRGSSPSRGALGVTDADLVARYRAGETCKVIAAVMGLSESVVRRRLKRAGVEMRRGGGREGHGRHELPVAEIIERYRAGESIRAIGRSLAVSDWTVRRRLIEAGLEMRRPWSHRRGVRARREEG
jgi:transposase